MKLSAKTEYACLAMLQLAAEYESGEPLQIRRIADEHGIPSRFLVQILLQLKGASLVASTRGAAGGYRLARPPQEISLADVIDVIEGDDRPESNAGEANAAGRCAAGVVPRTGRRPARPAGGYHAGRPGRRPPAASRCGTSRSSRRFWPSFCRRLSIRRSAN